MFKISEVRLLTFRIVAFRIEPLPQKIGFAQTAIQAIQRVKWGGIYVFLKI